MEIIKNKLADELSTLFNLDPNEVSLILKKYTITYTDKILDNIENYEYLNMFIKAKRFEKYSEVTLKNYRIDLIKFFNFTNFHIRQIDSFEIKRYLDDNYKNSTSSTLGTKITVLRSFFAWAEGEDIISNNPMKKIKAPKQKKVLQPVLNTIEIEKIRDSCISYRERAIFEFLLSTGCRVSEVLDIKENDIDYNSKRVKVLGKGNKERYVYLTDKALYYLNKYQKEEKYGIGYNRNLFLCERYPYNKMTSSNIQRIVGIIGSRAKIKNKLTPHVIRRTFATQILKNGADLQVIQHILGHVNIVTTQLYAQLNEDEKQYQFNKYFNN